MRDFSRLLKSNWFASDIKAYYDISEPSANEIKTKVINEVGCIWLDADKQKQSVSADEVIKAMGGVSRLEEIKIAKSFYEIKETD